MGITALWVGVGDGIGVALSRARTVAWTLKVIVDSMSIFGSGCPEVSGAASWAWAVASKAEGNGVCVLSVLPHARTNSIKKSKTAPNRFIPDLPNPRLVHPR